MKSYTTYCAALLLAGSSLAQEPILDEWIVNTDGTTASYYENVGTMQNPDYQLQSSTVLANVTDVCYDNDYVYIESDGMTTDMGIFTNPGAPSAQGYVWRLARNPQEDPNHEAVTEVFAIGVLINGVPIFGKGDARSWDNSSQQSTQMGQGIWNGEAFFTEGATLDDQFAAHPQQQGAYHSHASPFRLYDFPSSSHSPIVGFAADGFPVYGPYGYSDPMDAGSGVERMQTSYQLRSITQRHTLPDGTALNANEYGPDVSGSHPLGEFIEDYEYSQGLGTLDEYNGRQCVTPEYPNGTYAYFVTVDASNTAVYPYYLGNYYYGTPDPISVSPVQQATIPGNATCGVTALNEVLNPVEETVVFPNPASGSVYFDFGSETPGTVHVVNQLGQNVYTSRTVTNDVEMLDVSAWEAGLYFYHLDFGDRIETGKLLVAHE